MIFLLLLFFIFVKGNFICTDPSQKLSMYCPFSDYYIEFEDKKKVCSQPTFESNDYSSYSWKFDSDFVNDTFQNELGKGVCVQLFDYPDSRYVNPNISSSFGTNIVSCHIFSYRDEFLTRMLGSPTKYSGDEFFNGTGGMYNFTEEISTKLKEMIFFTFVAYRERISQIWIL